MLRWIARVAAVLVAAIFLFQLGGEIFYPHSGPPVHSREWTGIGLLLLAIAGMLAAWKWELRGALLSIAAVACFVFVAGLNRYDVIAALFAPGGLFLTDSLIRTTRT